MEKNTTSVATFVVCGRLNQNDVEFDVNDVNDVNPTVFGLKQNPPESPLKASRW